MILSALQNKAIKFPGLGWIQKRPVVTQGFAENPRLYKKFGLKGHAGVDFRASIGTELFAPIDGTVQVKDFKDQTYGLHVIITNDRLRVTLAHLSKTTAKNRRKIGMGEPIGLTGDSGNVYGAHLHMMVQHMKDGKVVDRYNGYMGGFDFLPYMISWKGTLLQNNL